LERGEEALNTLEEYANLYNAEFETDYNALNLI
jgi:hypothetical protein